MQRQQEETRYWQPPGFPGERPLGPFHLPLPEPERLEPLEIGHPGLQLHQPPLLLVDLGRKLGQLCRHACCELLLLSMRHAALAQRAPAGGCHVSTLKTPDGPRQSPLPASLVVLGRLALEAAPGALRVPGLEQVLPHRRHVSLQLHLLRLRVPRRAQQCLADLGLQARQLPLEGLDPRLARGELGLLPGKDLLGRAGRRRGVLQWEGRRMRCRSLIRAAGPRGRWIGPALWAWERRSTSACTAARSPGPAGGSCPCCSPSTDAMRGRLLSSSSCLAATRPWSTGEETTRDQVNSQRRRVPEGEITRRSLSFFLFSCFRICSGSFPVLASRS